MTQADFDGKITTMTYDHVNLSDNKKYARSVITALLAIHVVWMSLSFISVAIGLLPHAEVPGHPVSLMIFGLIHILAGCFVTQMFFVYIEKQFHDHPGLRWWIFCFVIILGLAVYLAMTRFGVRGKSVSAVSTSNLIVFACLCASWMAQVVKRPAELVPLCCVAGLADLFSVFAGPTKILAKGLQAYYEKGMPGPPPLTDFILLKISVPGIAVPLPMIGVSDWIVLVFLSLVLSRFGYNDSILGPGLSYAVEKKKMTVFLPVSVLGIISAELAAGFFGLFLPALPFIVIFFLGYTLFRYPETRKLEKKEWLLTVGFSIVMISLLVTGLYLRK